MFRPSSLTRKTRQSKRIGSWDAVRHWSKVFLLVASVVLQSQILIRNSQTINLRHWGCIAMGACFVTRVIIQQTCFWVRATSWNEVLFEAGGVIPLSLVSFAYGVAWNETPFSPLDLFGWLLFAFGTWLNLYPEYTRYRWKSDSKNAGRLYMGGLFRWARHINYTGEILSFVGFAIASAWWTLWVPAVMGYMSA